MTGRSTGHPPGPAALTLRIVTLVVVPIFISGLIPAEHRLAGIIVFLALAQFGTEVLRRQTAVEFTGADPAAAPLTTHANGKEKI